MYTQLKSIKMKFIFRGLTVLDYNAETKDMVVPTDEDGLTNFNLCQFIPEDYKLLARFFETAYKHTQLGDIVDLTDIVVD